MGSEEVWHEAIDPDSGDRYYWNVETGETTWDDPRPAAAAEDVGAIPSPRAQAVANAGRALLFRSLSGVQDSLDREAMSPMLMRTVQLAASTPKDAELDSDDENDDEEEDDEDERESEPETVVETTSHRPLGPRRSSILHVIGGKVVESMRPSFKQIHAALVVPSNSKATPFIDVDWVKNPTGQSSRETGFYHLRTHEAIVRCVHVTRTFKPAIWNVLSGSTVVAQILATRVISPRVFQLFVDGKVLYTLKRRGRVSMKILVFDGDSLDLHRCRYVLPFGKGRICFKLRDARAVGVGSGSTAADWRRRVETMPPNSLMDKVRMASGVDVALLCGLFALADSAVDYGKATLASPGMIQDIAKAAKTSSRSPAAVLADF